MQRAWQLSYAAIDPRPTMTTVGRASVPARPRRDAAAAAWEAIDQPYPAALALVGAAEVALSGGPSGREAAAARLRRAAPIAERLGARPLADQIAALPAAGDRLGHGSATGAQPERLGLTGREIEVLRLVTAGQSNREIAAALFISPKTASVHVSNILAKLGAATRTEAAARAHALRLFDAPDARPLDSMADSPPVTTTPFVLAAQAVAAQRRPRPQPVFGERLAGPRQREPLGRVRVYPAARPGAPTSSGPRPRCAGSLGTESPQQRPPEGLVDRGLAQPRVGAKPRGPFVQVTNVIDDRCHRLVGRVRGAPGETLPLADRPLPERGVHRARADRGPRLASGRAASLMRAFDASEKSASARHAATPSAGSSTGGGAARRRSRSRANTSPRAASIGPRSVTGSSRTTSGSAPCPLIVTMTSGEPSMRRAAHIVPWRQTSASPTGSASRVKRGGWPAPPGPLGVHGDAFALGVDLADQVPLGVSAPIFRT